MTLTFQISFSLSPRLREVSNGSIDPRELISPHLIQTPKAVAESPNRRDQIRTLISYQPLGCGMSISQGGIWLDFPRRIANFPVGCFPVGQ